VLSGSPSKPKRRILVAAAAVAVLLAPAADAADVTIGSNLAGSANMNICPDSIACTYVQTSGGAPVAVSPVDGTVVRWRLKAGSTGGTVKLRVLRPAGAGFTAVTSSVVQTVTSDLNTFSTSLPIKAGDVVALDNSTSGLYFTDSPSVALPLVKWFQPAIADGATGAPNNQQVNLELLMNADVTPTVPGVPPAPAPTPVISKLKLKPRTFRAARSGASVARKRPPIGTTVSYTLSTEATVAFKAQRARKGRRRGGKCKKPAKRARGKRCTRYVTVRGGFNVGGIAGLNKFRFTGRFANHRLRRGKYRLVATPSNAAKVGTAARARFRIR
jgi:hypothetical protein